MQGRASNCLSKLRQLRDALKASGGGRIHLDRLLEPWTDAVGERVRGVPSLPACLHMLYTEVSDADSF